MTKRAIDLDGGVLQFDMEAAEVPDAPTPRPGTACAWFQPTDSHLTHCRNCGYKRTDHSSNAVRRWVSSLTGQGRRR